MRIPVPILQMLKLRLERLGWLMAREQTTRAQGHLIPQCQDSGLHRGRTSPARSSVLAPGGPLAHNATVLRPLHSEAPKRPPDSRPRPHCTGRQGRALLKATGKPLCALRPWRSPTNPTSQSTQPLHPATSRRCGLGWAKDTSPESRARHLSGGDHPPSEWHRED